MSISHSDFILSVYPNLIGSVVGQSNNFRVSASNTSLLYMVYNLSLTIILPDGVSFLSSSVNPNSIVNNPSGTITITWTNIKDLTSNELDYSINLILKSDENFRSTGLPVPFDIPLTSINVSTKVDTLPRGNEDNANVEIIKTSDVNFIPLRYNTKKFDPGKVAKGAGSINSITAPLWVYEYRVAVENNTSLPSTVTRFDNLPDGTRYLDAPYITDSDVAQLSSLNTISPSPVPGGTNSANISGGTITLSQGSMNIITFNAAVWNDYNSSYIENSGSKIPNSAPLLNTITLNVLSSPAASNTATHAKDSLINKSSNISIGDVGSIVIYTLEYKINRYDGVSSFIITDTLPDGQSYIVGSASMPPTSVVNNVDGTTTITWNLGLRVKGTSGTITFNALIH
ncbi:hypothetical protein [uncultured Clostridium sp.]|uniref:hypothetical protein n=1 Tax=uncultured Clostridium sp. TaxID=59620 RepID=UPI0028E1BBB9|nr:hypothetical protein [uncultured Clostridium sp.]